MRADEWQSQRPCLGCGHVHLWGSPGRCWEAACDANCPEEHEGGSPYAATAS